MIPLFYEFISSSLKNKTSLPHSWIKLAIPQLPKVGFANDPTSTIISPTLSTIAVPAFDIGKISCELLLKHIRKSNFPPQELTLSGELIVRESTIKK